MNRVVVDSNVYISALVFGGVPQQVFEVIQAQRLNLYISQPIMDEVAEVLARKFKWTIGNLEEFLPPLWEGCIVVTPTVSINACKDPDDNRVLECALTGRVHLIISSDDHLKQLKSFQGIGIVRPVDFLRMLPK